MMADELNNFFIRIKAHHLLVRRQQRMKETTCPFAAIVL